MPVKKISSATTISLAILLFLGVILLLNPLDPIYPDFWYHASLGRFIAETRTIPLWDSISFQPMGRPHFYPPLLHLLISTLFFFSTQAMTLLPYLGSLLLIGFLLIYWLVLRKTLGETIALIALILVSLSSFFGLGIQNLLPSEIVLLGLFPLMYLVVRSGSAPSKAGSTSTMLVPSILLLTSIFYTHPTFSWLIVFGLFIFAFRNPKYGPYTLKTVGVSLLLFSPWLIHTAVSLVTYPNVLTNLLGTNLSRTLAHQFINIPLLGLSIGGYFYWKRRHVQDRHGSTQLTTGGRLSLQDRFLTLIECVMIGFLPLLAFYGGRFFWQLLPLFIPFAALPLKKIFEPWLKKWHWTSTPVYLSLIVLLFLPLPSFTYGFFTDSRMFYMEPTVVDVTVLGTSNFTQNPEWNQVVAWVNQNVTEDAILRVNDPIVAQALYVYTGHTSNSGMLWEVVNVTETSTTQMTTYQRHDEFFVYKACQLPADVTNKVTIGNYQVGFRRTDAFDVVPEF